MKSIVAALLLCLPVVATADPRFTSGILPCLLFDAEPVLIEGMNKSEHMDIAENTLENAAILYDDYYHWVCNFRMTETGNPEPSDPSPGPIPDPEPTPEPATPSVPIPGMADLLPRITDIGVPVRSQREIVRLHSASGDREEIGLFTDWQSEFIATGRSRDLVIRQADNVLDLPWCDFSAMTRESWREPPGEYGLSFSHTPNVFFLPYLLTGDTKYVSPMECQYKIYQRETGGPLADGSMKWLTGRDLAWQLRNLGQLAYIEKRGGTQQNIYVDILEKTRLQMTQSMGRAFEAEFHVLGENRLGNQNNWGGWFEGFIGMAVNHVINLGFSEWLPLEEWHFQHLIDRCGGRWPLKACDNNHVFLASGATWENTSAYPAGKMACYNAFPDNQLIPLPLKCGTTFITYEDRIEIARSWAAMAAENGIEGALELYRKLDAGIKQRGGGGRWFKYAILPSGDIPEPEAEPEAVPNPIPEPQPPATSSESLLDAPPGVWIDIADSKIADILPPESFAQPVRYIVGPKALVTAWNGAIFNTKLQRLDIFASGGHADYCGNEYLAFSLETLKWELIHGPSDLTNYDKSTGKVINQEPAQRGIAPDGRPISRHTYGGQVYHPALDKSFMFGGSTCGGAGSADDHTWGVTSNGEYEVLKGKGGWAQLGWSTVYDPASEDIYLSIAGKIHRYDVAENKKYSLTSGGSSGRNHQTLALDTTRNRVLAFGDVKEPGGSGWGTPASSRAFTWDIETEKHTYRKLTGDLSISYKRGVGLHYIASLDVFIAWRGGSKLYMIDPETFEITVTETTGPAPKGNKNGVYGRFAYSEQYQGFVVVTGINQNVRFLKLPSNSD